MADSHSPLSNLIRKLASEHYDPKVHGEGFIVTWNKKSRRVIDKRGLLSTLFGSKNLEFYFVKTHTKPIVIKPLPFEWHEGTSDVSLDFDATFKLRVTSEEEAKQLVRILSNSGTPEKGLLNLIDKHLYSCMARIYQERLVQDDKNLLTDFYQQGLEKGESTKLNGDVSREMQTELKGMDFGIGFTLRNAPERYADFKYNSKIKETGLEVSSECQLTLCNYQAFRKSGITGIDGVVAHMKEGIDRAIRQHILGKSEMELLSNFKTASSQQVSISDQVKDSVESQAKAIGYELKSFHTLPNIAPLQLLNGLMLVFDENDGAFKTGIFGGRIRLNIRMEVKAIEGAFDKYRHLFSNSESDNQIDLLNITQTQILKRVKSHIEVICREVLRQHQDNHLKALTNFENEVRPTLETEISERMKKQHGLEVTIKTLLPVESEDASRLEELRKRKFPFQFSVFSGGSSSSAAELTFSSSFEILGLDLENPTSWESFEGHDFGYRMDSSIRHTSGDKENLSDRNWKSAAIERELEDIRDELVRFMKSSDLLIPDLNIWLNDRKNNIAIQKKLIELAQLKIKSSRGLEISIERIEIQDDKLNEAFIAERDNTMNQILDKKKLAGKHELEDLAREDKRKARLNEETTAKEIELIDEEIDSFETLSEVKEQHKHELKGNKSSPQSLQGLRPKSNGSKEENQNALEDILSSEHNQDSKE